MSIVAKIESDKSGWLDLKLYQSHPSEKQCISSESLDSEDSGCEESSLQVLKTGAYNQRERGKLYLLTGQHRQAITVEGGFQVPGAAAREVSQLIGGHDLPKRDEPTA